MTQLRFLTLRDVVAKTALSESSIRRLVKEGDFPAPFDLTSKRIAFIEEDVMMWMQQRIVRGRKPKDMPVGKRKLGVTTDVADDFINRLEGVINESKEEENERRRE